MGKRAQSAATSAFTSSKHPSFSAITREMRSAIFSHSASFMPRVVIAGVPTRIPLVTKGDAV